MNFNRQQFILLIEKRQKFFPNILKASQKFEFKLKKLKINQIESDTRANLFQILLTSFLLHLTNRCSFKFIKVGSRVLHYRKLSFF